MVTQVNGSRSFQKVEKKHVVLNEGDVNGIIFNWFSGGLWLVGSDCDARGDADAGVGRRRRPLRRRQSDALRLGVQNDQKRCVPSFTEFYRVLPSFTEFYRVFLVFCLDIGCFNMYSHKCNRDFPYLNGLLSNFSFVYQLNLVLLGFTQIYLVLPSIN